MRYTWHIHVKHASGRLPYTTKIQMSIVFPMTCEFETYAEKWKRQLEHEANNSFLPHHQPIKLNICQNYYSNFIHCPWNSLNSAVMDVIRREAGETWFSAQSGCFSCWINVAIGLTISVAATLLCIALLLTMPSIYDMNLVSHHKSMSMQGFTCLTH